MIRLGDLANYCIIALSVGLVLSIGRALLIPLVIAMLLWFIVKQIRFSLDHVKIFRKLIPVWAKYLVSFTVVVGVLNFIIIIVYSNFRNLLDTYQKYEANIIALINIINERFDINLTEHLEVYLQKFDMASMVLAVVNLSTLLLSNLTMVIVYAVFLFLEEPAFQSKLKRLFPQPETFENAYNTIKKIEFSVSRYLGVKTLISFTTGLLSYIVLEIFSVDFPVFWAFLIFVLNYIPAIGSIIATLFPVAFSLLQFGDLFPGIFVLLSIGTIQFFIGNFLDPKIMGDNINLSPLVIILSLAFWGTIWGVIGAILSVPITVVIVIILSKFPNTRPIAIMLSGRGDIG
ncbi:MAG TPA: AI-2E family transporter [Bacteroidales bacterium]|nr:AI-2E family transporter [Bacteroidales bacterium]